MGDVQSVYWLRLGDVLALKDLSLESNFLSFICLKVSKKEPSLLNKLKTAELLIEKGASVNAFTPDNQTPLHWAAQSEN
jgi:ankyrin repeat protein